MQEETHEGRDQPAAGGSDDHDGRAQGDGRGAGRSDDHDGGEQGDGKGAGQRGRQDDAEHGEGPDARSAKADDGPDRGAAAGPPTPGIPGDAPGSANEPPPPLTRRDLWATAALGLMFLAGIALALLFARPFRAAGLQAFEEPDAVGNVLWYIGLILLFTFFILWIAKRGHKWVIRWIILAAVAGIMVYVVPPVLMSVGVGFGAAVSVGAVVGIAGALLLWRHPEWYVIDTVGLLVGAAAAAVFGISLSVVPVMVLLVALAVYDAIAVYRTKHMLSLADSVLELRLPVLLVVPKHMGYRFRDEGTRFRDAGPEDKEKRDALFMGLGDIVIPAILVVSAFMFGTQWGVLPAAAAAAGILVGFGVLMSFVLRGRPHAGLPLLNGGAITGFLVGLYAATGSLVFW